MQNQSNDDNMNPNDAAAPQDAMGQDTGAAPRVIVITIRSVMEKGDLAKVQVRTDATVRELRMACYSQIGPKSEGQSLIFEGKELK